jgi:hypothetical protein
MPLQSNVFLSNHHYLYDSSSFFMNEKLQRNLSRKGSPRGGGGGGEKKIHSNLSHLCDKEAIVASASPRGISFALQNSDNFVWRPCPCWLCCHYDSIHVTIFR